MDSACLATWSGEGIAAIWVEALDSEGHMPGGR